MDVANYSTYGLKRGPDTLVSPLSSPILSAVSGTPPGMYLCNTLSSKMFPDKLTSSAVSSTSPCIISEEWTT